MPTCWRRRSSPRGRRASLAFIMEPIGGAATDALVAPDSYYPRIREICDRYGILLIHDEVMSGVGAHRQIPRRRPLELPAGHRRAVEGHRLGLRAARRDGGAGAHRQAGARHGRLPARPHLCRQSAGLRGRACGAAGDRPAGADRQRGRDGRGADGRTARARAALPLHRRRARQGPADRRSSSSPTRRRMAPLPRRRERSASACSTSPTSAG